MCIRDRSSNVLCLYSSGLSIATLIERASLKQIIAGIGIIGTAIAFVPAQGYLVNFLVVLGVVIPPVGAIYLIDSFLVRRFSYEDGAAKVNYDLAALLSWLGGSAFGFLSQSSVVRVTGISSIDSLIVTALILTLWKRKQIFAPAGRPKL